MGCTPAPKNGGASEDKPGMEGGSGVAELESIGRKVLSVELRQESQPNDNLIAIAQKLLASYQAQAQKATTNLEVHWVAVVSESRLLANVAEAYISGYKELSMVLANCKGLSGIAYDGIVSALAISKRQKAIDQAIQGQKPTFEKSIDEVIQQDAANGTGSRDPMHNNKKANRLLRSIKNKLMQLMPAIKWSILVLVMPPIVMYEIAYLDSDSTTCLKIERRVGSDDDHVLAVVFGTLGD
jgi:hypothetical protein